MTNFSSTEIALYKRIGIMAISIGILGYFIPFLGYAFTKGLLLGSVFTLFRVRLLQVSLHKALTLPEVKAKGITYFHYMMRFLLTAVILVIAFIDPTTNALGVIIGLMLIKPAVLLDIWFPSVVSS